MKPITPRCFTITSKCLQWLAGATGSPEPALLRFELALLTHLGYGVDFLHCTGSGEPVDDAVTYRYREEKGLIASVLLDRYRFSGREFPDVDTLRAAKRFTSMALKPYLGGKPLKSRELFHQFLDRRPVGAGQAGAGDDGPPGPAVKLASNKLACATTLVYTATQYRQKLGEGEV